MNKHSPKSNLSRRHFLSAAATATVFSIVPRHVLGGAKFVPPSEKVNIAIIGAGGQGRTNARALFNEKEAQIIAVCDVAEETNLEPFYYKDKAGRKVVLAEVEKHYQDKEKGNQPDYKCAEYEDFRDMLEREKSIDAILCATPDHLHALVSITSMKQGKHVYCEKPLTHSVWEAREVAKVAKETGLATQMGNQGHSNEGIRQTCEWIWDGAIGQVTEVHAWSDTGGWATGKGRPKETPEIPSGFNWDKWLGPREERPYSPAYAPYNWRGWWAFGTGAIGDMACHNLDAAVWALKLEHPLSIEASTTTLDSEVVSPGSLFTYRFGPRSDKSFRLPGGQMGPLTVRWYDGGLRPALPLGIDPNDSKQRMGDRGNGIIFIGEKGVITCGGWGTMPRLLPLARHREYQRPEKTLPRSKGHHTDWLKACKGGDPASGNFDYSARLTEIVLLGNVALRSKKHLQWDGPAMKIPNAPEAEKFLKDDYRKGWEIA